MPAYRSHKVLEIIAGLKAFLKLEVGLTRGEVPDLANLLMSQQEKLRQARARIERQSRGSLPSRRSTPERTEQIGQTNKQQSNTKQELSYESIYDSHIQKRSADVAIGAKSFEAIGRLELEVLRRAGLKPTDSIVDFGCGTGRLAVNVIPALAGGHYTGIDISQTMITEAKERVEKRIPNPPCRVSWRHQTSTVFELGENSVDMICAFSVINHMEHEDSYSYFKEALRITRPGGRFVYSCLPIDSKRGEEVFLKAAAVDLDTRYRTVRHVATSRSLMEDISRLAGWKTVRWYDGDERNIQLPDTEEPRKFGQTICVLEAPGKNRASA